MVRWLATLLVVVAAGTASAKVLCPPGQFEITPGAVVPASLTGRVLELGTGVAAIPGACRSVRAGDYHRPSEAWLARVRARWNRCGGRAVRIRARFDLIDAPWCTRLVGTLRIGARTVAFTADRVPVCGNGLREAGEECEPALHGDTCCDDACRVRPLFGCFTTCDHFFPCPAGQVCALTCGGAALCRTPGDVDCEAGPVCSCDQRTTYPTACAAYEAGTGVSAMGACPG